MKRAASPESPGKSGTNALDLGDDAGFHRRERLVRRVGLGVIVAILCAAFVGLFGGGPVSHASARSSDGQLRVSYERFVRANAPAALRIRVVPSVGQNGSLRLWIDRAYVRALVIEELVPTPSRSAMGSDRVTYDFAIDGSDSVEFVVRFRANSLGSRPGALGVQGGSQVRFRQFVFP